jgi:hypothetical protein
VSNPPDLTMWVVYDHPKDFPFGFVTREWVVTSTGGRPTNNVIKTTPLEVIRTFLEGKGLVPLGRSPIDDPCIVETWM